MKIGKINQLEKCFGKKLLQKLFLMETDLIFLPSDIKTFH